MDFATPLIPATFVKREKRFFAYCVLEDGTEVTAHCANTGSLKGVLNFPIKRAWLSHAPSPTRKLAYSLEVMEMATGALVGVHTGRTNTLAGEFLATLYPGCTIQAEAKWDAHTRFDFKITAADGAITWVEVKTVTCTTPEGGAMFPDAVSTRGLKHLHVLMEAVARGEKALQLYLVLRTDCPTFRPAEEIDPDYAAGLKATRAAGVQVLAYQCHITPTSLTVDKPLPLVF